MGLAGERVTGYNRQLERSHEYGGKSISTVERYKDGFSKRETY